MELLFKNWIIEEAIDFNNQLFYHGGIDKITQFQLGKPAIRMAFMGDTTDIKTQAIFFSTNPKSAEFFGKNRAQYFSKWMYYVHVAKLHLSNVLNLNQSTDRIIRILERMGFDPYKYFGIHDVYLQNTHVPSNSRMEKDDVYQLLDEPDFVQMLKKAGYDGVIIKEGKRLGFSMAVLDPNKIELIGYLNNKNEITPVPIPVK